MTTVKNTKGIIAGCLGVLLSTLLPFENSQADSIQANVAVVYGKSIPGFPGKIPDGLNRALASDLETGHQHFLFLLCCCLYFGSQDN